MSGMRHKVGRLDEAISVAEEAVGLYRPLAERNPDGFRAGLAHSLNNLGGSLKELGRHEEALQALRETLELLQPLAQRIPEAFQGGIRSTDGDPMNAVPAAGAATRQQEIDRLVTKYNQSALTIANG